MHANTARDLNFCAARACRDKLKQAKGWMKEQHIPHDQALVALQYLQQSFKSKAVHGKDGKPDCAIQNLCGYGRAQLLLQADQAVVRQAC